MAFNDLEFHAIKKEVEAFVESTRPPQHLRGQVDNAYRIDDQTVKLFQVRPTWQGQLGDITELPTAKITYDRTQKDWKLYWQRANLKWELYKTTKTLGDALELVRTDPHGCFFG